MPRYREDYTLYKRGKYWYYRTYDSNGIRTVQHTTGKTSKIAAREWCEQKLRLGTLTACRITYGEYSRGFYDEDSIYVKTRKLSKSTLMAYSAYNKNAINPYWDKVPLSDITCTRLEAFTVSLEDRYSPSAICTIMGIMRNVIQRARRDGLLTVDPFEFVTVKKTEKKRDAFTLAELSTLLDEVDEPDVRSAFLILAVTGMRIGEALAIDDSKLRTTDSGMHYLRIDCARSGNTGQVMDKTKTGKVWNVPISDRLIPMLPSLSCRYTYYINHFRAALKRVEIQDSKERLLAIHSLRHFFTTQAKLDGVNPLIVETITGHSLRGSSQMEGTYTNFHVDDLAEIIPWQEKILDSMKKS